MRACGSSSRSNASPTEAQTTSATRRALALAPSRVRGHQPDFQEATHPVEPLLDAVDQHTPVCHGAVHVEQDMLES